MLGVKLKRHRFSVLKYFLLTLNKVCIRHENKERQKIIQILPGENSSLSFAAHEINTEIYSVCSDLQSSNRGKHEPEKNPYYLDNFHRAYYAYSTVLNVFEVKKGFLRESIDLTIPSLYLQLPPRISNT